MPSAVSPPSDDLDNLFNYDDAVDDFLKDLPLDKNQQNPTNNNNTTRNQDKNIDEEITIRKKRAPIRKLDETLLQSGNGLPKLRKITKSRLKFRGKGYEFADMERMLSMYQLWLDELYPRAKFRDGLAMVEKLGHGKRMQVMRRAWLDGTKPSADVREPSPEVEVGGEDAVMTGLLPKEGRRSGIFDDDSEDEEAELAVRRNNAPADNAPVQDAYDAPDDDELDALMADNAAVPKPVQAAPQRRKGPFDDDEDEDDDDLDALLAEQSGPVPGQTIPPQPPANDPRKEDDFADEEEAMADMDMW